MLDTEAARDLAIGELSDLVRRARGLRETDWSRSTPCPGWDVETLVRHAAAVAWQQAEAFRRATLDVVEPPSYLQVGVPRAELIDAVARSCDEIAAAVDAVMDEPDRLVPLPFSAMPAAFAVYALVVEYGFHRWDLFAALDGSTEAELTVGVVETHLETVSFTLGATAAEVAREGEGYRLCGDRWTVEMATRDGRWVAGPPDVAATIRGDDNSIALFTLGRTVLGDERLAVTGDAALAERFTRYFPGLS